MLRFRTLVLPLVCFVLAGISLAQSSPTSAAAATAPHFPTNEDLRHLKALSAPILSPDGKEVLFTLTHATADGAANHLWIVSVASGSSDKARQLTFSPPADKRGEHNAQWAPDSSAIFFLAKRGDHTQLFRLDLRKIAPLEQPLQKLTRRVHRPLRPRRLEPAGRRQTRGSSSSTRDRWASGCFPGGTAHPRP